MLKSVLVPTRRTSGRTVPSTRNWLVPNSDFFATAWAAVRKYWVAFCSPCHRRNPTAAATISPATACLLLLPSSARRRTRRGAGGGGLGLRYFHVFSAGGRVLARILPRRTVRQA